jgi:hypothetical protein
VGNKRLTGSPLCDKEAASSLIDRKNLAFETSPIAAQHLQINGKYNKYNTPFRDNIFFILNGHVIKTFPKGDCIGALIKLL